MSEVAEKPAKKPRKPRVPKEAKTTTEPTVEKSTTISAPYDWKQHIPDEFIEIQTDWFLKNGINPATLSKEERQELKARAGEENQLIKLGGFKYLAHLRGIRSLEYNVLSISDEKVSLQCLLSFDDEVDPNRVRYYCGIANASKENTSYPFSMYLESMAENRAFIRAVKAACNINVLGVEEVQGKPAEFVQDVLLSDDEGCTSPQESLRILIEQRGKSFPDLKQSLIKKEWEGAEAWSDFKDVPPEQCLRIIETIQSKPSKA